MKKFSWKNHPKPFICLAPMDGWTDSPFRQIIKEIAPQTIVFTEFVSVDGITHHNRSKELMQKAIFHEKIEKPLIVQLFGKNPEKFALAAKMMEELGADAIDINFGCPAKKVINSNNGAALLKNPQLASEIVQATKQATKLPVSVKTRLGWEDKNQIFDFGELMLKSGADLLTVHGRTAKQKFLGEADLEPIFEFKKKHPNNFIIGNGDIKTVNQALEVLDNLDGIMIGREAMQNPWIFKHIFAKLNSQKILNKAGLPPCHQNYLDIPETFAEKVKTILKHTKLKEKYKGRKGILEMRKFFAALTKGFNGASNFRNQLVQVETYEQAEKIFREIIKKNEKK